MRVHQICNRPTIFILYPTLTTFASSLFATETKLFCWPATNAVIYWSHIFLMHYNFFFYNLSFRRTNYFILCSGCFWQYLFSLDPYQFQHIYQFHLFKCAILSASVILLAWDRNSFCPTIHGLHAPLHCILSLSCASSVLYLLQSSFPKNMYTSLYSFHSCFTFHYIINSGKKSFKILFRSYFHCFRQFPLDIFCSVQ